MAPAQTAILVLTQAAILCRPPTKSPSCTSCSPRARITQAERDQAKAKLLAAPAAAALSINRLRLSDDDKWIAGVCGGIGAVTGVESWIWRLIFVLGLLFGGLALLLYLLLWIFVPREGA